MRRFIKRLQKTTAIFICFYATGLHAQVNFVDVAAESGLTYTGKSFGGSWADINGDGLLDLFMSCHFNQALTLYDNAVPHLFLQLPNGTFTTTTLSFLPESDIHGAGFFDFDRDGDLDMLNVTGRAHINVFFKNDGSLNYVNRAEMYGLDNPHGRGRMPTFLDVNNDGYLDVILNNRSGEGTAPSALLLNNQGTGFTDVSAISEFPQNDANVSILGRFSFTGKLEFLMSGLNSADIYLLNNQKFQKKATFPVSNISDVTVGDFSGNLHQDVYFCRAKPNSQTFLKNDTLLRGQYFLNPTNAPFVEIKFKSDGDLNCKIIPRKHNQIFSINKGSNPPLISTEWLQTTLSVTDSLLAENIPLSQLNGEWGHWNIRRENGFWIFKAIPPINSSWTSAIEISAVDTITEIETIGVSAQDTTSYRDVFYFNNGSYSFTESNFGSVYDPLNASAVVTADFDNDMDLDLYIVATNEAGNTANYLLENDGQGNFIRHDDAWGAAGSMEGIGESVSLVDFDNDGFMDLFVTNGLSIFFLEDAPIQLFRNSGNDNHWLKMNLVGVQSNPSGIGSTVLCFAGGKAQLRMQDGGIHARCQNDDRIQFGLGPNTTADSILVVWPTGKIQKLYNVACDQIIDVVEPAPAGITAKNETFDVRIFPRPSSGTVFVEAPDAEIVDLFLYNALGQLVDLPKTTALHGLIQMNLSDGLYFITLIDNKGRRATQKIIVQ